MKFVHQFPWLPLLVSLVLVAGCERKPVPAPVVPDPGTAVATAADEQEFARKLGLGLGLMGQFKYPEAYALFQELSDQYPEDLELLVNAAVARLNMAGDQDLEAALGLLEKALTKQPEHLRANYCAGLLKTYLGPPADPLPHFRIAGRLAPDDADVVYLLAKAEEQAGDLSAATRGYLRCLELNEYYASALLGLGRTARMEGKEAEAAEWLKKFEAMKSNPNCRIFEFAYKRMGKYGEVNADHPAASAQAQPLPAGSLFSPPRVLVASVIPERKTAEPGAEESANGSSAAEDSNQADAKPPIPGDRAEPAAPAWSLLPVDWKQDGQMGLVCFQPATEIDSPSRLTVWHRESDGSLLDRTPEAWRAMTGVESVLCGDVNEDGLPDLYFCRRGKNQLWYQLPGATWQQADEQGIGDDSLHTRDGRLIDADHDGDLDIVCLNADGTNRILNNNRDGTWRTLELPSLPSRTATWVAAGDLDNQRDLDLCLGGEESAAVLLNQRLWDFAADPAADPDSVRPGIRGSVVADLDHDGRLDWIQLREDCLEVWTRSGAGSWARTGTIPTGDSGPDQRTESFAVADLDGDGKHEVILADKSSIRVLDADGKERERCASMDSPILGWNLVAMEPERGWSLVCIDAAGKLIEYPPGPGRHQFVAAAFTGKDSQADSMRSNRSGIGSRWKARVGSGWTTGMTLPVSSLKGQGEQLQLIGLRGGSQLEFLAVDWSDGVFQAELALQPGAIRRVEETQRQLASCPLVFAWNGRETAFVTDVLGVGGIGFLTAPGQYAPPRPWENLLLPDSALQPRNGKLEVKLGEPMEEACYLLSARMSAIDLPAGWEAVLDERMGISDPQPTGQPFWFRTAYPVRSAVDQAGGDQTAALADCDAVPAVHGSPDARFIGLMEQEQLLAFSFGEPVPFRGRAALVIDGWVEYPYSQTVFAAWQAGLAYEAPSLEASDDGQTWEPVWEQWGYPAGMPRTILLPLPEQAIGRRWYRLRTKMQVYWDRIRLVDLEDCPEARLLPLQLSRAELRRSGFARRSTGPWHHPDYDYSVRQGTWDSRHLPGDYTRFGDIAGLLGSGSGALTIFGPGEEVHMEFQEAGPLPPGWSRQHLLHLEGWCKDLDLYTGTGDQLRPLPQTNAADPAHAARLHREYNWRYESGPWFPVTPASASEEESAPERN